MYHRIHCSNSCPILELSVKFTSQMCHENISKPLDGAYLADLGIDIRGIERAINVVVCQNENLYGIQRTLIWSGSLYVLAIYR